MVESRSFGDGLADALIYVLAGALGFLCLVPLLNTLAISFSSSVSVAAGEVSFWPKGWTTEAYRRILGERQFFASALVSLKRVVLGGAINFVMMTLGAFALSRSPKKFRGRNVYMWIVVTTMLFQAGLIPTYLVVNKLGLIDSIWALVLPGAVPVWYTILLMNFFRSLPKELEESAEIDGSSPLQVLVKIYIPMSLPSIATVMLFSLVGHWNEFFSGLVYMRKMENYPLATYITQLVSASKALERITDPEELERIMKVSDGTFNAAKIFVSIVPILVLYAFAQRFFKKGLVLGAVKE